MSALPNPFDSGDSQATPDEAAASSPIAPSSGAAADISEPSATERGIEEAPASTSTVTVAAGDAGATDLIAEIFVGARKMDQLPGRFDQAAITGSDELLYVTLKLMDEPGTRDLPDIPDELWAEFDDLPLFLRTA